ncbi:MAG: VCBS repeat-containing protein, partial [Vicinamibacterales bacterium]|nr:VCBS repeat-containing protein [Vicinamibacterales bacterium]
MDIAAGLEAVRYSSVAWGDYDNDGDLDILLTGEYAFGAPISRVYRNDGGSFVDIAAGLEGVRDSSVAWGDYDNDGDLDILLTGEGASGYVSRVYRNDGGSFVDIAAGLEG